MKIAIIQGKSAAGWLAVLIISCGVLGGLARAQEVAGSEAVTTAASVPATCVVDAPPTDPASAEAASAEAAAAFPADTAPAPSPQATTPVQTGPRGQSAAAPRDVSERTIFPNILRDQKDLWLFPLKLDYGRHWFPVVSVAVVTAGLISLDEKDTPYFRNTSTFATFNKVFAGNITTTEILAAPASFYLVGLFDKDPYARKTGLFAGEALADVTILEFAMKGVTRRLRPSDIPPNGDFSDSFFKANHNIFSSSFPSGHTISAFAVATVIARRYGHQHRWVPYVAYAAAGVIGFSRISLQAHFPSDVFLGAALGYSVARFDVLRQSGPAPNQ